MLKKSAVHLEKQGSFIPKEYEVYPHCFFAIMNTQKWAPSNFAFQAC